MTTPPALAAVRRGRARTVPTGEPMTDPTTTEAHRLALSEALGLGTGAPWDAIHDRATELAAASAVSLPPADQTAPSRRAGLRDEIAAAVVRLHESGGLFALDAGEDGRIADAVLPVLYREWPWLRAEAEDAAPADQTARRKTAEAVLAAVETALCDELVPSARAEALAGIAAVLPATTNHDTDTGAPLSETERKMLDYALDLADEEIATDGSDFTDDEEDALAELRRIVTKPIATGTFELRGDTEIRAAALREAADEAASAARLFPDNEECATAVGALEGLAERLRRVADETAATETQARRGDQFEAWLKAQRDDWASDRADVPATYDALDDLLDLYRLHADTGTPLSKHVCEARVVGDCECLEQPAAGARQDKTVAAPCVECDHPQTDHEEGEDPVTPGHCRTCPDDEDRHDYRTAAGARQDGVQRPGLRERHRAAWNALTPEEQTARLAELDAIDEEQDGPQ